MCSTERWEILEWKWPESRKNSLIVKWSSVRNVFNEVLKTCQHLKYSETTANKTNPILWNQWSNSTNGGLVSVDNRLNGSIYITHMVKWSSIAVQGRVIKSELMFGTKWSMISWLAYVTMIGHPAIDVTGRDQ